MAQFAADLRHRVLGTRFRHVKALVAHAEAIGVGRSTIYSALSGHRLPSEYTLGRLLDVAAGTDPDELRRWVAARAEIEKLVLAQQSSARGPDPVAAPGLAASPVVDPPDAERDAAGPGATEPDGLREPVAPAPPAGSEGREPGAPRSPDRDRRRGSAGWGRAGWAACGAVGATLLLIGLEHLPSSVAPTEAAPVTVTAARPPSAPTTQGAPCTYLIIDPGGADVRDFPAGDARTYGSRRLAGQLVQSRRPCTSTADENTVAHGGTRWVQVIVGGPATNINGWMDDAQLLAVSPS